MPHRQVAEIDQNLADQIAQNANIARAATAILWHATGVDRRADDQARWASLATREIAQALGADYVALALAEAGRWKVTAEAGTAQPLPTDLLANTLDREMPDGQGPWVAAPLSTRDAVAEVITAHLVDDDKTADALSVLAALTPVVRTALRAIRTGHRANNRIRRLEAILSIAGGWNQTHEVEPLLAQMAEAATDLLGADRASIFLWDKANHMLVGRPALGIEGGELRIADDRGVVGQVIQTGEPRRVDTTTEPKQVDHDVDAKLGYQTETLSCVPLHGASGELFGAFELINKLSGVFTKEDEAALVELAGHAAIALESAQNFQQLLSANRQITEQAAEGVRMIGQSPAIEALRSIVRRVADTELAVLILGENGTGKEIIAQSIHYLSRRREKPFVALNCAAIPDTLAESELFGHEKGAFTDAHEARAGKFELAAGGTLLLDEIGDLSLAGQAKLLRVLEERVLVRVGGSTPIHTDTRVLASTNQNLAEMVREKRFREDLYFRLNVVTLELPPLRDRAGDVLLLAEHFLGDFCKKARRKVPQFSEEARQRLAAHPWPGNIRELRNLMERLAYLSSDDRIEAKDLAFILSPGGAAPVISGASGTLNDATTEFQAEYICQTVERCDGNMSRAADELGLHRSNLYRKMRQLGMDIPR